MSPRRVVVTGASGNVGTALLLRLGLNDGYRLTGVSRRPPPLRPPYSWARWISMDLGSRSATGALDELFRHADAVVHLAWQLQPSRDHAAMRRTNIDGTRAVIDAAMRSQVPHLIHMSSVGAYSPGPKTPVGEEWPTAGVPTSSYSVDKADAERILDKIGPGGTVVSRLRPGLIFQDAAASEVARYFLGPLVPRRLIRPSAARLVPLPADLAFQVVHADDVAAALEVVLQTGEPGAFNVAADPVIDRAGWHAAFGGVGPRAPVGALRAAAAVSYAARLQPTEPGWIDLAAQTPLLDTARIRALGWEAQHDATDVLARFVAAIGRRAGRPGPLLDRDQRSIAPVPQP